MTSNAARNLFDRLVSGGVTAIERMILAGAEESLHLEAKQLSKNGLPLSADDRKNIAKSLSGFANAEGGVVLWGVQSTRGDEGLADRLCAVQPLREIENVRSKLVELCQEYATPYPEGVEHICITTGRDDEGVVATFIPAWDGIPVMAMTKTTHRHYMRIGSSFRMMENYILADRFARRPPPQLRLNVMLQPMGTESIEGTRAGQILLIFKLENSGRGIAAYPMLRLRPRARMDTGLRWDSGSQGLPRRLLLPAAPEDHWVWVAFAGGAGQVIHAGTALHACGLIWALRRDVSAPGLAIDYELHCEGHSSAGVYNVSPREVARLRDTALGNSTV